MNGPYKKEAEAVVTAIKKLADNEHGLQVLESFLSSNFKSWLLYPADTPKGLADELLKFANMETATNQNREDVNK